MAANKFATMLHIRTNKITLILVYAVLEWILIFFLLLNSLFSYLIIKYAEYFGLKKPCLWCSRLDHFFDSKTNKNSYRDLVCDDHAEEISKLGFCSNHRKLSESQDMCEDCSSSSQPELSKDYAFFRWMKQIGLIQGTVENGEMNSKCSCCGVSLERNLYTPYVLLKPFWEALDYTQKGNLIKEEAKEEDGIEDDGDHSDQNRLEFVYNQPEDVQRIEEHNEILIEGTELETEENCSGSVSNSDCKEMVINEDEKVAVIVKKEQETIKEENWNALINYPSSDQSEKQVKQEASPEIATKHLEFYIDGDYSNLIPIELIDRMKASEEKSGYKLREDDLGNEDVILDFTLHDVSTQVELFPIYENEEEEIKAAESEPENLEVNETDWTSFMQAEVGESKEEEEHEQITTEQRTEMPSTDIEDDVQASAATVTEDMEADVNQASDASLQTQSDEIDAEISIGTDIPDHEPIDDIQTQEDLPSYPGTEDGGFTSFSELQADNDDNGYKQSEGDVEFKTVAAETSEEACNDFLPSTSEVNEIEEEKVPDTPTSIDSMHQLHKKLLLLDRIESGTEESLDGGSVISDIDAVDGVLTVEKLKSALRAERKALNASYIELEEERSASAVAANQTMAMINRLQEEKAAMQMEALQYQRMMDEQSEFDQEALQLLNELMVKKEKEKAEIEKELEIYRKKVQDYEVKERMQMLRRSRTSSASCSNAEDSDGLSIDLNHEVKEDDGFDNNQESSNQNTPADAVLYLGESLANFEEERLLILEQLKILEEKLFTLNDEDEQHFEDIKPIDHFYEENGNEACYDENFDSNGVAATNGHVKEMNGKHHHLCIGSKAKTLLPLFDIIGTETEDGVLNGNEQDYDSVASQNSPVTKFEPDNKRVAIEKEVDHVYERLQALEADREFLKHCISSLRKGDKGIYLLQEILQHLRDLRNVEIRARNMAE